MSDMSDTRPYEWPCLLVLELAEVNALLEYNRQRVWHVSVVDVDPGARIAAACSQLAYVC